VSAALQNLYAGLGVPSPVDSDVYKLITGIVKGSTSQPLVRSKVMPREPFVELFRAWDDNELLNIGDLRLKAITLLSLTIMLRSSDVAPRAVTIDEQDQISRPS